MIDILTHEKGLSGKGLLSANVPDSSTLLNLVFKDNFSKSFLGSNITLLSNKNRSPIP